MGPLLSTVQGLPADTRAEIERALEPYARRAAVGALAGDIAHDAGNALFGLVGLLDLLEPGAAVDASRQALLQHAAAELSAALTPLLHFARGGDDRGARGDLVTAASAALSLYRHGARKLLDVDLRLPDSPARVGCPPSLALQLVVHLLLAADPVALLEVEGTTARVGPARAESLDELVAARLATDCGGSLVREDDLLVLRLPSP